MSRLSTDGRRNVKIELEFWKQNSQLSDVTNSGVCCGRRLAEPLQQKTKRSRAKGIWIAKRILIGKWEGVLSKWEGILSKWEGFLSSMKCLMKSLKELY